MIHLSNNRPGFLSVATADTLYDQLQRKYAETTNLLKNIDSKTSGFNLPTDDHRLLATHPLAQGLTAYSRGEVTERRAGQLASDLASLPQSSLRLLESGRLTLLQRQSLLPEIDTRGEVIRVTEDSKYTQDDLNADFEALSEACGPDFVRFTSVIKTFSVVEIHGRGPLPYFSGVDTTCFGAMHASRPADKYVLAETVTHEAAHTWLFILEEVTPIAHECWEGDNWISPWRDDARPIGGVIHGVFVFSCAALVLECVMRKQKEILAATEARLAKRISRLVAQVEAALEELRQCPNLTDAGASIAELSKERISGVITSLDDRLIHEARSKCLFEMSDKRNRHRSLRKDLPACR